MTACLCEPVVLIPIAYLGVSYAGMECRRCGARNISNNARPGEIDRVVVDMLVDWMMHRGEVTVDADTGQLTAFKVKPAGLRLAVNNQSLMETV